MNDEQALNKLDEMRSEDNTTKQDNRLRILPLHIGQQAPRGNTYSCPSSILHGTASQTFS